MIEVLAIYSVALQSVGILCFGASFVPGRCNPEPPMLMKAGVLFLIFGLAAAELILIIVLIPFLGKFDVTGLIIYFGSGGSDFIGLLGRA